MLPISASMNLHLQGNSHKSQQPCPVPWHPCTVLDAAGAHTALPTAVALWAMCPWSAVLCVLCIPVSFCTAEWCTGVRGASQCGAGRRYMGDLKAVGAVRTTSKRENCHRRYTDQAEQKQTERLMHDIVERMLSLEANHCLGRSFRRWATHYCFIQQCMGPLCALFIIREHYSNKMFLMSLPKGGTIE